MGHGGSLVGEKAPPRHSQGWAAGHLGKQKRVAPASQSAAGAAGAEGADDSWRTRRLNFKGIASIIAQKVTEPPLLCIHDFLRFIHVGIPLQLFYLSIYLRTWYELSRTQSEEDEELAVIAIDPYMYPVQYKVLYLGSQPISSHGYILRCGRPSHVNEGAAHKTLSVHFVLLFQ